MLGPRAACELWGAGTGRTLREAASRGSGRSAVEDRLAALDSAGGGGCAGGRRFRRGDRSLIHGARARLRHDDAARRTCRGCRRLDPRVRLGRGLRVSMGMRCARRAFHGRGNELDGRGFNARRDRRLLLRLGNGLFGGESGGGDDRFGEDRLGEDGRGDDGGGRCCGGYRLGNIRFDRGRRSDGRCRSDNVRADGRHGGFGGASRGLTRGSRWLDHDGSHRRCDAHG